jgi:hypothetical protein
MLRKLHIIAIALVLLFLLCVPLSILLYAVNPLLGGLILLTPLVTLQVLTLKALQRRFPSKAALADAKTEVIDQRTDSVNEETPDNRSV